MAYTYDLTTDVGKVRALTRDTRGPTTVFFQDDEIQFYLTLNGDDVRYAAAELLDVWASDEAMVTKVVTLLDVSTNGASVAAALRAHAKTLRELADQAATALDAGFDTAEMALGPFSLREQIVNEGLKEP
jgi:hypothetical protein